MSRPSYISCIHCGYNIAGLASGSVCPECAYPIEISAAGHRELGVAIAHPLALARLLRLLGILQLGFSLWFVFTVFFALGKIPLNSNMMEPIVYCLGLAFWLATSITSSFVSARMAERTPRNSFALLVALRTATCVLLMGSIALSLAAHVNGMFYYFVAIACAAFATAAELFAAAISARYVHAIIQSLPLPLRNKLRTLNLTAIVCFYLAFFSGFLFFVSPLLLFLIPLAPAFASFRSFTLSRRIRAAIGER